MVPFDDPFHDFDVNRWIILEDCTSGKTREKYFEASDIYDRAVSDDEGAEPVTKEDMERYSELMTDVIAEALETYAGMLKDGTFKLKCTF